MNAKRRANIKQNISSKFKRTNISDIPMKRKRFILLVFSLAIVSVAAILLFVYLNSSSSSNNNNNNFKPTYTDDSDSPQPPSTLEYNRTLAPPKRNNNIVNACASGLPKKCYDKINGFYYKLPGDISL